MNIFQPTKAEMEAALEAERQLKAERESLTGKEELDASLREYWIARYQYKESEFSQRTLAESMLLILELQTKVAELEARIEALEYGSGPENDL